jgi:hypothetical protein
MRVWFGEWRRQATIRAALSAGAFLAGMGSAWAQLDCGYDELRCARGIDRSTCLCIGEAPRQPSNNACASIQTTQDAQRCYAQKIQEMVDACRTSPGWTQDRLDWWDSLDAWREQAGLGRMARPRC